MVPPGPELANSAERNDSAAPAERGASGCGSSRAVLRGAAVLLAVWAVLATTTFVWTLENGGVRAVSALLRSPLLLVQPRWIPVWLEGVAGSFAIFTTAFVLNQAVGRGWLQVLRLRRIDWPAALPLTSTPISLWAFDSSQPEAFSFTLVERHPDRPWRPRRREVVLLSEGLLARLTSEEQEAVIAHELAHVVSLDARYLTFVRTFARMMRWDPVLAYVARTLTRRAEVEADRTAVGWTGRPRALASALAKAVGVDPTSAVLPAAHSFRGLGGPKSYRVTVERLRRLRAVGGSRGY